MNGSAVAALLLAAATLVVPPAPHHRLPVTRSRAVRPAAVVVCAAAAAAVSALPAPPSLVLVCLALGGVSAMRIRRRRRYRQRRRQGQAMASALDVLVGEMRVGANPLAAFMTAAGESTGPVGRSLCEVAGRAQLGADVAAGMRAAGADSAVPAYWDRLAVFWDLAADHGLAMSTLMRAAHCDIVDRQRFADRMNAALAGPRATAVILATLPALGVLLGQLIGAHPVGFLLGGGLGGVLLVVGVSLICAGVLWADRIIDGLLE